jgi:[ribosomal protein S5]-alanine N-acetyltransferase
MQPTLRTERLVLRPFRASDAALVAEYAGDADVARNTLTIPHPYPAGHAETWIAGQGAAWTEGRRASFAVCLADGDTLCGAMGLEIERLHARAELGYWIGRPFWNRGFASEAARELVAFAFGELGLQRVFAFHFHWNSASGRVLEKVGMRREGFLRGHVLKAGKPIDEVLYGILRGDAAAPAVPAAASGGADRPVPR